ncbi:MAG: hypothetical protein LBT76_06395 [Tannerella sp.]|jgi:rhamnogalacturonan endolyase|nr:hypothetical protein [Tannerella sp.]
MKEKKNRKGQEAKGRSCRIAGQAKAGRRAMPVKQVFAAVLCVTAAVLIRCAPPSTRGAKYTAGGVQVERLDRGFVAFTRADTSVYLGWRLLEDDPPDVAFNLYRKTVGAVPENDFVKVNGEPIRNSTDYVDRRGECDWLDVMMERMTRQGSSKGADGEWPEDTKVRIHEGHVYKLTRVVDGREEDVWGGETYVFLSLGDRNYRSILLNDIHSYAGMIGVGDLDGDGAYDYVVLLDGLQYTDPGTTVDSWHRSRDTYRLEAYSSTGKFLWQYDMGWAVETGTWYAPFLVYDLDGDGKAEVYTRGGEGDPRELDGRVLTGAEYLLKIDGETGRVVKKRPWIPRSPERARSYDWINRHFLALAYLDGKHPSLIVERGNYGIIRMEALDKNLEREWYFESTGEHEMCWGCGGHTICAADIDGDGRDELVPGTYALDHDGKPLWSLGLLHNDGCEVTDIDPDRPGLEIFYNIESRSARNGVCMVDAATGRYLMEYDKPTEHVHGHAAVGDFDPAHPGMECFVNADRGEVPPHPFLYSSKGERLSDTLSIGRSPYLLWWDGDEYKEILDNARNGRIYKFGGDTLVRVNGYVPWMADIFGDWREEYIVCTTGEIRIYSSTIPAGTRKVCLAQDHQYRMGLAAISSAYQTPPQPGLPKTGR